MRAVGAIHAAPASGGNCPYLSRGKLGTCLISAPKLRYPLMHLVKHSEADKKYRAVQSAPYLLNTFRATRQRTVEICEPLAESDHEIQTMPDVSPPKWHLAHTSWFFETFILIPGLPGYRPFHPQFHYLFNSYYKGLGPYYPRAARGQMSRPALKEVHQYRNYVEAGIEKIFAEEHGWRKFGHLLELGIHHEQQHQELLLTDILHIFFCNPLHPAYQKQDFKNPAQVPPFSWRDFPEGLAEIGHSGEGFAFDNERPRHRVFLESYRLADRVVSNGEYMEFLEDGAYQNPRLWLSDGWDWVEREKWVAPMYWEKRDGKWWQMSLSGMQPLLDSEPVCFLSFYEADAFARWAGKRLPTEAEWEHAALPPERIGDVWEWTGSPYQPYPRFIPASGFVGEYNGKFMCNQMVLRGGSCLSAPGHLRLTYRNFFYPHQCWQCAGIRMAEDA